MAGDVPPLDVVAQLGEPLIDLAELRRRAAIAAWPPLPSGAHPPLWAACPACDHLRKAEVRLAMIHLKLGHPGSADGPVGPVCGVIVGEQVTERGRLPMFPWPHRSSGGRLLAFSGLTPGQYLGRLRRLDLVNDPHEKWSAELARTYAADIMATLAADLRARRAVDPQAAPLRVVLCGARVSAAFGIAEPFVYPGSRGETLGPDAIPYVSIPHPSARNPVWNHEPVVHAAGVAVRWAAGYL